jgi:hypothetical protein
MSGEEKRYTADDFSTPSRIREAHYDRMREAGAPRENAERIARKAVEKAAKQAADALFAKSAAAKR